MPCADFPCIAVFGGSPAAEYSLSPGGAATLQGPHNRRAAVSPGLVSGPGDEDGPLRQRTGANGTGSGIVDLAGTLRGANHIRGRQRCESETALPTGARTGVRTGPPRRCLTSAVTGG